MDFRLNVSRHRRADVGEGIGRRSGQGKVAVFYQLAKDGMAWAANADRGQSGGDDIRDARSLGQYEGEGPWPEGLGQLSCGFVRFADRFQGIVGSDMANQWVIGGAFLDFEDLGAGRLVQSVGGESVNGFGGDGYELS